MVTGIKNNVNHVLRTVKVVSMEKEKVQDNHIKFSVKIVLIQNSCWKMENKTNVSMNAQIIGMLMSKRDNVIDVDPHVINVHLRILVSPVDTDT